MEDLQLNINGVSVTVPFREMTAEELVNHSIGCFGGSRTRKTTMVKHILRIIRKHVPLIYVFNETDQVNKMYSGSGSVNPIPKPLISGKVTIEKLKKIYRRNDQLTKIYNNYTMNIPLLERIFNRVASNEQKLKYANLRKVDLSKHRENMSMEHLEKIKLRMISAYLRGVIGEHKKVLRARNPDSDTRNVLEYLNLNPNIVIIFDDLSAELETLCKDELLKNLFFKGRWASITVIFAFHSLVMLPKQLRENMHIFIFCGIPLSIDYAKKHMDNTSRRVMEKAVAYLSSPSLQNTGWKIIYNKDFYPSIAFVEAKFYEDDVEFCSTAVRQFCQEIEKKSTLVEDNDYIV